MIISNPIKSILAQDSIYLEEYCAEDSTMATQFKVEGEFDLFEFKLLSSRRGYSPIYFSRLNRIQLEVDGISFHITSRGLVNASRITSPSVFISALSKVSATLLDCYKS
ncbi:hypothetical protein ST37_10055 [Vibrio sp. qd031]|nr:hypothetical protein ST37_10055 [Vibrio sp. qd031]